MRRWWPYAVYAAIAVFYGWPLLAVPNGLGIMDWDQHLFYYGSVLKSLAGYGQLPFWNPWYCGGDVLWQNPQIALLSPVYPLTAVVSLPLAMKVNVIVHVFAGLAGMHLLLTRVCRLTFFPAVLFLSCLFALTGGIALHLAVGHSTFLTFEYLPLLLFFFLQGIQGGRLRDGFFAGAVGALAIVNGGIHAVAMAGVGLAVVVVVGTLIRRDLRPITMLAIAGVSAALLSAPKLVPETLFLQSARFFDTRGGVQAPDTMRWTEQFHALVDPGRPAGVAGWWEYGNYIGLLGGLVIAASVMGAIIAAWRRERWLALSLSVATILALWLGRGQYGPYAPFALLQKLPVYSGFRNPGRYAMIFALFGAALAGAVISAAWRGVALSGQAKRWLGAILMLAAAEQAFHNRAYFEGATARPPLDASLRPFAGGVLPPFDTSIDPYGPNSPMYRALAASRMSVNCFESLQVRPGVQAEKPLVFADPGVQILSIGFAPNRIDASAMTGDHAVKVYLNQNYIEGWSSSRGPLTSDSVGSLGYVVLPAGFGGSVTFSFFPPGLWSGLALLAAGLVFGRLVWRRTMGAPDALL